MTIRIGFIGLGIMGKPMALNLMRNGYPMWVYGRRPESMETLAEMGATACGSPRQVAENVDILFIMVSDTPDVEQVIIGENGVLDGAKAGAIVVDMSTISPGVTRRMAAKLQSHGIHMLDAPVSGGDVGAINATLSFMVGGKQEIFEQVKPLFQCMGKNIVHVGDNSAGQVAKACNQIVAGVTIQGVAEALTFARKNGVDPGKVRDALMGGFASSKILEVHGMRMLKEDFNPGFKAKLHQKDLNIVMQTALELGLALPAAALIMQNLNALVGSGDGDLDSAAMVKVLERMSKK